MAAITQLHWQRYCNQDEAQDGLCTAAPTAEINADQRASSLFADASYPDQTSVNAANDYATELIQPIVPAAIRGDALSSVAGQDADARRRGYNAQMSLARGVLDDVVASRAGSVTLTTAQQQQMQVEGLTPATTGSWYEAIDLRSEPTPLGHRLAGIAAIHAGKVGHGRTRDRACPQQLHRLAELPARAEVRERQRGHSRRHGAGPPQARDVDAVTATGRTVAGARPAEFSPNPEGDSPCPLRQVHRATLPHSRPPPETPRLILAHRKLSPQGGQPGAANPQTRSSNRTAKCKNCFRPCSRRHYLSTSPRLALTPIPRHSTQSFNPYPSRT